MKSFGIFLLIFASLNFENYKIYKKAVNEMIKTLINNTAVSQNAVR